MLRNTNIILMMSCVMILMMIIHSTLSTLTPTSKFMIWPDPITTESKVLLWENGTVVTRTLSLYDVGKSAWNDVNAVTSSIRDTIASGQVVFVDSYHFGDTGWRNLSECPTVIAFDQQVAKAIGSNFAIINIESEWDVGVVLSLFQTNEGIQCFQNRILQYNTYAPNALITSAPGLWNSYSTYNFFQPVEKMLNLRSLNINAVNSGNTTCSRVYDGSYWTSGQMNLNEAKQYIDDKIVGDLTKMNNAWGQSQNNQFLAFSAVTSCGWGFDGQAEILSTLINNLDCLYENGFRGFNLRNSGPAAEYCATGINNEQMYTYSTSVKSVAVLNEGWLRVRSLFSGNVKPNCTLPTLDNVNIQILSGSDSWWLKLQVNPSIYVYGNVNITCNGVTTSLSQTSWSTIQYTNSLNANCPNNSIAIVSLQPVPNIGTITIKQFTINYFVGSIGVPIITIINNTNTNNSNNSSNNTIISNNSTITNGTVINNSTITNGTVINNSTIITNGTIINNNSTNNSNNTNNGNNNNSNNNNNSSNTTNATPSTINRLNSYHLSMSNHSFTMNIILLISITMLISLM
ncbi:predicted protein [Naegleria gruberi]|uniref:Predicted protein n=1 Tax=Naegleria gruberi TaxID=5762 RepID=D2V1W2_NAEGR|nr:uncharacterized protein NAEGRDRAFT_62717 [Naegleria gruberi]EFC49231.1 predicted protein [Naegleria gruberi]|eukprot:XP_002681975.1 predicted protein [Naegleria gruberi strain NEG-M]